MCVRVSVVERIRVLGAPKDGEKQGDKDEPVKESTAQAA